MRGGVLFLVQSLCVSIGFQVGHGSAQKVASWSATLSANCSVRFEGAFGGAFRIQTFAFRMQRFAFGIHSFHCKLWMLLQFCSWNDALCGKRSF